MSISIQKHSVFKARVCNPGGLASKLARFESGTSSKSPPSCQCSVQSHAPTNLNAHLAVGLSREKEMPEHDAAIQLNLARSRQEVKCRNNKQHPVTFQNKTLGEDTCTPLEASCLLYCAMATQTRAKPDRSRNAADPYLVETGPTH